MGDDAVAWARQRRDRVFLTVTVRGADEAIWTQVLGYRMPSGPIEEEFGRSGQIIMTFDEFEWLSAYADLAIDLAHEWEGSVPMSSILPEPLVRFVHDASSWEEGVVADCLCRSFLNGAAKGVTIPVTAPFVKAVDRAAMAKATHRLMEMGYSVYSYGHGHLRVGDDYGSDVIERDASALGLYVADGRTIAR
jgi:hypothetical protein